MHGKGKPYPKLPPGESFFRLKTKMPRNKRVDDRFLVIQLVLRPINGLDEKNPVINARTLFRCLQAIDKSVLRELKKLLPD